MSPVIGTVDRLTTTWELAKLSRPFSRFQEVVSYLLPLTKTSTKALCLTATPKGCLKTWSDILVVVATLVLIVSLVVPVTYIVLLLLKCL